MLTEVPANDRHQSFPAKDFPYYRDFREVSRRFTIQIPLCQSAYSWPRIWPWLIHARSCANSVQFYGDSWHGVLYARSGQAYRGTALEAAWASHRGRSPSPCMATASQIVCLVCEGSDSINSMLLARNFQQRMGKQPQQRGL